MTLGEAEKQAQAAELLARPVLARLATARAGSGQPHVVPVWFVWDGECAWVSAFDSTRKMKDLRSNPLCALLIEPPVVEPGKLEAVLLEGRAELIKQPPELVEEMSRRIYARYMGAEGAQAPEPLSWSRDPENTLVRLAPSKTYLW